MDTDSNQTSGEKGLALLRGRHQELAATAARTGVVPKVFEGDPAFADLMKEKRSNVGDSGS